MNTTMLKKTIRTTVLLLGLALAANAQTTAGGGGGTPMIDKKLNEYKTMAGASDDQLAKIRPILEKERAAKKALPETLSAEEKDAKLKEIYKTTRQEVNKILTPEQTAKLKAAKEAAKGGGAAKSE